MNCCQLKKLSLNLAMASAISCRGLVFACSSWHSIPSTSGNVQSAVQLHYPSSTFRGVLIRGSVFKERLWLPIWKNERSVLRISYSIQESSTSTQIEPAEMIQPPKPAVEEAAASIATDPKPKSEPAEKIKPPNPAVQEPATNIAADSKPKSEPAEQIKPPKPVVEEVAASVATDPKRKSESAEKIKPPKPVVEEAAASIATDFKPKSESAEKPPKPAVETAEASIATDSKPKSQSAEKVMPPKSAVETAAASTAKDPKPRATITPKVAPKKLKSLQETMEEDIVPLLLSTLGKEQGLTNICVSFADNQLTTSFAKNAVPYSFFAFFPDGTLEGSRGAALASHGSPPSTIEPFLIDEKKITPELVVFWIKKRLFAQKVLSIN